MWPRTRIWIACQSSELERRATDRLCDLLGGEGLLIEHAAPTLLRRADRIRLLCRLYLHRHLGRRVLVVRRLDRLSPCEQTRLCLWLASRPGADWIVVTGRVPELDCERDRLEKQVLRRFKPAIQLGFDRVVCPETATLAVSKLHQA